MKRKGNLTVKVIMVLSVIAGIMVFVARFYFVGNVWRKILGL